MVDRRFHVCFREHRGKVQESAVHDFVILYSGLLITVESLVLSQCYSLTIR